MKNFLLTVETVEDGLGFTHFDVTHISWLVVAALLIAANTWLFHHLNTHARRHWMQIVAVLLLLDEVLKFSVLFIGGTYTHDYLPLHLCSINVFVIALHAVRPSKTVGNFLYMVCIPGALAALLFPTWTSLPVTAGMHIHSFTAHILLLMYPIVLCLNGEIKVDIRYVPRSFGMLIAMAAIVLLVNISLGTNFMFLMFADPGNPLYLFETIWGSHLWGFPVIITGVLLVLYGPLMLLKVRRKSK